MTRILLLLPLVLVLGCATTRTALVSAELAELRSLMTGSFDSSEQARADSTYFDISLKMYPIWTDQASTYLYVEQAVSAAPERPYRQRIYRLRELGNGRFASDVFALSNEKDAIGKWNDPAWFDQFKPEDLLVEREGCTVFLTKIGEQRYAGSTEANNCKSTLRGATYATSQVVILPGEIGSWDQGWNDAEEQVWGATEGGYVFKRSSGR